MQQPLFDPLEVLPEVLGVHKGRAHKGHEVQQLAAEQIKEVSGEQCAAILKLLRKHPEGLIQEEIASILSMQRASVCARCDELRTAGLATDTDDRRKTSSGRSASVWRAV